MSTSPTASATGTLVGSRVLVTFSENMDPASITTSTFMLKQGTTAIPGAVTYTAKTATLAPTVNLSSSTAYTATITTGAKSSSGHALALNFVWSFTTGLPTGIPDITRPTILSTSAVSALPLASDITATFSEAMDPSTITSSTFTVTQGTTPVSGATTYAGVTATFNPAADFAADTTYTATVTTGARDVAGNSVLANHVWTFVTVAGAGDTTAPAVVSTSAFVSVPLNSDITVTFSETMQASSITASSFTLVQGVTAVAGVVSYSGLVATLNPGSDLTSDTFYNATITVAATDLAGNPLAVDYRWELHTLTASCTQATVTLGTAANFAVLAGSTVTSTGMTTVTGDLGVSPGTDVTGFGPGVIVGDTHAGDGASAQGIADLTTAYNDAAGRSNCAVLVSGNLGGMTLAPGLYKSTSGLEISSGDLYLDAQGDSNAVFIFQMASTLDVAAGLKVYLINGTKASNVFWQIGTSASFGTNSTFVGNVMADQSISFATGASLDGRALARIGAVTMDTNAITKPTA